jgi:hypothetical protein
MSAANTCESKHPKKRLILVSKMFRYPFWYMMKQASLSLVSSWAKARCFGMVKYRFSSSRLIYNSYTQLFPRVMRNNPFLSIISSLLEMQIHRLSNILPRSSASSIRPSLPPRKARSDPYAASVANSPISYMSSATRLLRLSISCICPDKNWCEWAISSSMWLIYRCPSILPYSMRVLNSCHIVEWSVTSLREKSTM